MQTKNTLKLIRLKLLTELLDFFVMREGYGRLDSETEDEPVR